MDNPDKNKPDDLAESSADEETDNLEELAPLRALKKAVASRIRCSTSRIRINESGGTEFVSIEGVTDPESLACLEESVSDIISNSEDGRSSQSKISEHQISSIISHDSSNKTGSSSTESNSSFYSIPSCKSSFEGIVAPESLQNAEEAISDLEKNGPAGLLHLSSLSDAIGKPIRVWCSGNSDSKKVGRTKTGKPIEIEYHEPESGEVQGHWTLPGNREPNDTESQLNDCLFGVVAEQVGRLAPELRAETISRMRKNVKSLARRIEKIAKLEGCERISLLVGGARYNGRRPQDAKIVIDNSQHGGCAPNGQQGHPRGHASHPQASGATESAENYSHQGMKSAFLSREDQDAVGHLVLSTAQAQRAMGDLNRGATSVAIHVSPGELEPGPLPLGVEFSEGQRVGGERPIREFTVVLRHHQGQVNNPEADVFVHTFYPRLQ